MQSARGLVVVARIDDSLATIGVLETQRHNGYAILRGVTLIVGIITIELPDGVFCVPQAALWSTGQIALVYELSGRNPRGCCSTC